MGQFKQSSHPPPLKEDVITFNHNFIIFNHHLTTFCSNISTHTLNPSSTLTCFVARPQALLTLPNSWGMTVRLLTETWSVNHSDKCPSSPLYLLGVNCKVWFRYNNKLTDCCIKLVSTRGKKMEKFSNNHKSVILWLSLAISGNLRVNPW